MAVSTLQVLISEPLRHLIFYSVSATKIWNSLYILQSQTLSSFRRHLKTHFFQSAYPAPSAHPQMRPDSLLRFWRYINHLTYCIELYYLKVQEGLRNVRIFTEHYITKANGQV